jgi:dTDP-4-dehydrorhamnose 3,5-epimerase
MKVIENPMPDLYLIEANSFPDDRGWFLVAYGARAYEELGPFKWEQDNVSQSSRSVLRGLHFQHPNDQLKLVQVLHGAVYDAVVDVRVGSPTFGKWYGVELSSENHLQLLVPEGFAHGFVVISETAVVYYKAQGKYDPSAECGIRWDDPEIGIEWPVSSPILNERDQNLPLLSEVDRSKMPQYPGG